MSSDEEEFRAFVVDQGAGLQRFAWRLTSDWGLAEDVVQIALVKVWRKWGSIVPESRAAYVRKAILSSYLSWRRLRANSELAHGFSEIERPAGDDTGLVDDRIDVARRLQHLSRRQHAVLVLRYLEDLSEADTAQIMNCSVGSVKRQTSRAIAKLRDTERVAENSHES